MIKYYSDIFEEHNIAMLALVLRISFPYFIKLLSLQHKRTIFLSQLYIWYLLSNHLAKVVIALLKAIILLL